MSVFGSIGNFDVVRFIQFEFYFFSIQNFGDTLVFLFADANALDLQLVELRNFRSLKIGYKIKHLLLSK